MEVKMAATTRILKKLSLGHLTELFHRDNNTTDMICNQQGTRGHDEFAITIMLACHDPETSVLIMVTQYLKATARKKRDIYHLRFIAVASIKQ